MNMLLLKLNLTYTSPQLLCRLLKILLRATDRASMLHFPPALLSVHKLWGREILDTILCLGLDDCPVDLLEQSTSVDVLEAVLRIKEDISTPNKLAAIVELLWSEQKLEEDPDDRDALLAKDRIIKFWTSVRKDSFSTDCVFVA